MTKNQAIEMPRSNSNGKTRRPDQQVYQPPIPRNRVPSESTHTADNPPSKTPLFTVEYEDENGKIHELPIYKDDNLRLLCTRFGKEVGLSTDLITAFHVRVSEEFKKRKR